MGGVLIDGGTGDDFRGMGMGTLSDFFTLRGAGSGFDVSVLTGLTGIGRSSGLGFRRGGDGFPSVGGVSLRPPDNVLVSGFSVRPLEEVLANGFGGVILEGESNSRELLEERLCSRSSGFY